MRLVANAGVDPQRLVRTGHRLEQRLRPRGAVERVGPAVQHEQGQVDGRHALFHAPHGRETLGPPTHRRARREHGVGSRRLECLRVARQ